MDLDAKKDAVNRNVRQRPHGRVMGFKQNPASGSTSQTDVRRHSTAHEEHVVATATENGLLKHEGLR